MSRISGAKGPEPQQPIESFNAVKAKGKWSDWKRSYLAFDANTQAIILKVLNIFERFARTIFGAYKETHQAFLVAKRDSITNLQQLEQAREKFPQKTEEIANKILHPDLHEISAKVQDFLSAPLDDEKKREEIFRKFQQSLNEKNLQIFLGEFQKQRGNATEALLEEFALFLSNHPDEVSPIFAARALLRGKSDQEFLHLIGTIDDEPSLKIHRQELMVRLKKAGIGELAMMIVEYSRKFPTHISKIEDELKILRNKDPLFEQLFQSYVQILDNGLTSPKAL